MPLLGVSAALQLPLLYSTLDVLHRPGALKGWYLGPDPWHYLSLSGSPEYL